MKRKLTVLLTILAMLVCAVFAVVGCTPEEPVEPAGPEGGAYYCVTNDDYRITLEDNNKFTFKVAGENRQGTYRFAGNTLILTFDDDTKIEATLDNYNEMNFEYKNKAYTFLRETNFKVKFETSGGSAVNEQTVKNGKKATRPNSPTKNGSIFTGWYADEGLENEFDFESAITKNTTLYAKYIDAIARNPEFTAKFENTDTTIESVQTKGGIVDINKIAEPSKSGDKFLGWYVSASNEKAKLTYKYEFQILNENTTLYALWASDLDGAPEVSVYNGKVTWTGESATLSIKTPSGETVTPQVSGNEYTIPASTLSVEGEYEIKVTVGEKSTTRYYVHKGLARVSVFKIEGNTVQFNRVDNAESYELTVTTKTGDQTLEVKLDDTNRVGHADFSACDIPENGYVFKVKATANGFSASESDPYTYNRVLDSVANINVDEATQNISWDSVTNATGYVVEINNVRSTVQEAKATLRDLDPQSVTIKVQPTAFGYNSPVASEKTYNKVKLAVPENIRLEGTDLTWDPINGAQGYEVKINGQTQTVTGETLTLTDSNITADTTITIVAKGKTSAEDSPESEAFKITKGSIGNVYYEAGKLKWDAVFGKHEFVIKVADGEEITVSNATEKEIVLTGKTTEVKIKIQGTEEWKTITVKANEIKLAMGFDNLYFGSMFKQKGDPIDFNDTDSIIYNTTAYNSKELFVNNYQKRTGYEFAGFYNNAYSGGGEKYTLGTYIFDGDTEFFAKWTPHTHNVSFDLNFEGLEVDGTDEEIDPTVFTYASTNFNWPVPQQIVPGYMFEGWYVFVGNQHDFTTNNKYTNENGVGTQALTGGIFDADITAYARWVLVVTFVDNKGGWTATKNDSYKSMTRLTIPAMYKDKRVTQVENFQSCLNLTEINIPDTVTAIHMGEGGEAFKSDSRLVNVNIYHYADNKDTPKYCSIEGVVYENDDDGNLNKLFYYPYGRLYDNTHKYDEYTIAKGTKIIGMGAFFSTLTLSDDNKLRGLKIIHIPASVEEIEQGAFTKTYGLTTIDFLPAGQDEKEATNIVLYDTSFDNCPSVDTFNLPKRVQSISATLLREFTNLTHLTVEKGSTKYSATDNVLYMTRDDGDKELVFYPHAITPADGKVSIATDVQHIGKAAFKDNKALRELTISALVETIGEEAFKGCSHIQVLEFLGTDASPDLKIEKQAFYNVSSSSTADYPVTRYKLVLPANLVYLGENAFGATNFIKELEVTTSGSSRSEVSFAAGAFKSTSGSGYVESLTIGPACPEFNITEVLGTTVKIIVIQGKNPNYAIDDKGVVFDDEYNRLLYFPIDFEGEYSLPSGMVNVPEGMFKEVAGLTKITIPDTVRRVGKQAFYKCESLREVIFNNGTLGEDDLGLVIEDSAFAQCGALTTLTLPNTLYSLGVAVFQNCYRLDNVQLPDNLTMIGDKAFQNCSELSSINIPKNVILLQRDDKGYLRIFQGCGRLAEVNVDQENTSYISVQGILYSTREVKNGEKQFVADTLIYCPANVTGDITVPGTVRTVAGYAFNNISGIKKITFATLVKTENANEENPDDVLDIKINHRAFENDSTYSGHSIEEIEFPEGMTALGDTGSVADPLIYNLDSLTKVIIPNTVVNVYKFLGGCDNVNTIEFVEGGKSELRIEDSTSSSSYGTTSGKGIFSEMPKLKTIKFPKRLTYIGSYAFVQFSSYNSVINSTCSLDKVEFTESEEFSLEIGANAFEYATFPIELPNNTTKIGNYAFAYCPIKTIEIPDKVTIIGDSAFAYTGIENITIPASVTEIGYSAFASDYNFVYANLKSITFAEGGHLKSLGKTSISTGTSTGYVFNNQRNLTSIKFAANNSDVLLTIYRSCFASCSSLKQIELPYYLETLEGWAFSGNKELTTVTFTQNKNIMTKTLGQQLFENTSISEFIIPDSDPSVTELTLGAQMFKNCANFRTLRVPDTVKTFSVKNAAGTMVGVLDGCAVSEIRTDDDGNPNFTIDNNNKIIYDKNNNIVLVFGNLTQFNIPDGTTVISNGSFAGIVGLKSIVIPASVTTIEEGAFRNCLDLTTVSFIPGNSLKEIGNEAFAGCKSLTTIDMSLCTNLTKYGSRVFAGCKSLTTVKLPNDFNKFTDPGTGTKVSGMGMFSSCISLETIDLSNTKFTVLPYSAFLLCTNLREVTLPDTITTIANNSFNGCTSLTTINGLENVTTYKGAMSSWANGTKLSSFVLRGTNKAGTAITYPANFFKGFDNLTITLDDETIGGLKSIPNSMFEGLTNLKSFDFTKLTGLESIGTKAFMGTGLTEVDLSKCTKLKTFVVPTSGTDRTSSVFLDCADLVSVNMEGCDALTALGGKDFQNCTSLTTVKLPTKITFLGTYAFSGCTDLESIDMSKCTSLKFFSNSNKTGQITTAARTFEKCTSLTEVILPEVANIELGAYVFSGCTELSDIDLKNVVMIGTSCFENCAFDSITLSSKITKWGTSPWLGCPITQIDFGDATIAPPASMCKGFNSLTVVDMNDIKFTELPSSMFEDCTSLKEVRFDASKITKFGNSVFKNTAITTMDLSGYKGTALGTSLFEGCAQLTSVTLPKTLTAIPSKLFYNCSSLANIDIVGMPLANTNAIGTYAFAGTAITTMNLSSFTFNGINTYTFQNCANLTSVTLPNTLAFIANYAFQNCTSLEEIDLTNTQLTAIGTSSATGKANLTTNSYVFDGCTSLATIKLPATCTQLNGYTFSNCPNLTNFDTSKITLIGKNAFENSKMVSINLSAITQVNGAIQIGANAFNNFTADTVDLGGNDLFKIENVTSKDISYNVIKSADDTTEYFFYEFNGNLNPDEDGVLDLTNSDAPIAAIKKALTTGTSTVKKLILPAAITEIPDSAFVDFALELDEIAIPEGVTSIGANAFSGCVNVKKFTLPDSLLTIGDNAFKGCGFTEITITKNVTSIGANAFDGCATLATVTFTADANVVEPLTLGASVFANCVLLNSVTLIDRITEIPDNAFNDDAVLANVNIPDIVTSIGASAFNGTAIVSLKLSANLLSIGDSAFQDSQVATLVFNDEAQLMVGKSAFQGSKLANITFPKETGSVSFGALALSNTLVTKLEIPSNAFADGVAQGTFMNCALLREVTFKEGTKITILEGSGSSSGMFLGCVALETVVLAEGIEVLGDYCFSGCTELNSVTLPESLTEIDNWAFKSCSSIERIIIPENVGTIENYVFAGWNSNQTVVIIGDRFLKIKVLGTLWMYATTQGPNYETYFQLEFKDSADNA